MVPVHLLHAIGNVSKSPLPSSLLSSSAAAFFFLGTGARLPVLLLFLVLLMLILRFFAGGFFSSGDETGGFCSNDSFLVFFAVSGHLGVHADLLQELDGKSFGRTARDRFEPAGFVFHVLCFRLSFLREHH